MRLLRDLVIECRQLVEGGGSRRSKYGRQAAEIGDYGGLRKDQVPSSRSDVLAAAGTSKFQKFGDKKAKLRMYRRSDP